MWRSSGAAEFGDVAGAVERGWAGCRRWLGAVSGVGCQIRLAGIVHFLSVTSIRSLRTPNKSGPWPVINGWWGLAKFYLTRVGSVRTISEY